MKKPIIAAFAALCILATIGFLAMAPGQNQKPVAASKGAIPIEKEPARQSPKAVTVTVEELDVAFKP